MKKIKLKERDITKIIGMVLKEQDLSKIEWYRGGKHESWFQYYNTFNGCRSQFTNLLKKLVEYFGEKVTQEANQLIVSFKRGMIQVKNKRKDKLSDEDKNIIVSYLKPEFERIGIEFLDEDQKELDRLEEKRKLYQQYKGTDKRDKYPPLTKKERLLIEKLRKKKELVDTALWDYMFMLQRDSKLRFGIGASIYRTCAEEYMDAKRKYETQIDDDRDYDELTGDFDKLKYDYTQISGDNKELANKLKTANIEINRLKKLLSQRGNDRADIKRKK